VGHGALFGSLWFFGFSVQDYSPPVYENVEQEVPFFAVIATESENAVFRSKGGGFGETIGEIGGEDY
jgi:hypothetical protein